MACMVCVSVLRSADLALTIRTNRILELGPSPAREARPLPDRERGEESACAELRRNPESRVALSSDPLLDPLPNRERGRSKERCAIWETGTDFARAKLSEVPPRLALLASSG
jgi:hypothetical protein